MNEFSHASERQFRIFDLLNEQGGLSVAEIVEHFSISEATARRDLEMLAAKGKIRRVHGGVVSLRQAAHEAPLLQRSTVQSDEKQRIGRAIDLENGLTNDDLSAPATDRAIVNSGRQVVVVADHSKVNTVSYVSLAPLSKINTIVTDERTDAGFLDSLREAGISVIVA